ncbi:50S ribosomal protein L23 [Candidatus Parcubacteria bacterium]|nr:50S ribosomal protein L23 [Candidatus Parcubacteria bacterium]
MLLSPHVTEKATQLVADNQYVFKIFPRANKTEVKKAIESLYKVKVISVKIINVSGKTKRLGKNQGWKKGYKKAIIKLAPGQRIEAFTV